MENEEEIKRELGGKDREREQEPEKEPEEEKEKETEQEQEKEQETEKENERERGDVSFGGGCEGGKGVSSGVRAAATSLAAG